jgi:outer membrane protein assembly factor BamE
MIGRLDGVLLIALLLLAGCMPKLTPYQMPIQQGNVVTQEMLAKLKPGMTPSQVRFILGTPLVVDAFHKDRWDYVYRYTHGGTVQEQRRIVVVFQDDKLARIEGDVVPAKPGSAAGAGVKIDKPAPAKPAAAKAAPKPKPETAAPAPPDGSKLVTSTGEPVEGGSDGADAAAKAKEEKPKEEKPQEERGFFGRMLEKLGF